MPLYLGLEYFFVILKKKISTSWCSTLRLEHITWSDILRVLNQVSSPRNSTSWECNTSITCTGNNISLMFGGIGILFLFFLNEPQIGPRSTSIIKKLKGNGLAPFGNCYSEKGIYVSCFFFESRILTSLPLTASLLVSLLKQIQVCHTLCLCRNIQMLTNIIL